MFILYQKCQFINPNKVNSPPIDYFTVVGLPAQPLSLRETEDNLVLIQTFSVT